MYSGVGKVETRFHCCHRKWGITQNVKSDIKNASNTAIYIFVIFYLYFEHCIKYKHVPKGQ